MPINGNARENITPKQSSRDSHAADIPQAVTPRTRRAGRSGTRRARGFGGRGAPASGLHGNQDEWLCSVTLLPTEAVAIHCAASAAQRIDTAGADHRFEWLAR